MSQAAVRSSTRYASQKPRSATTTRARAPRRLMSVVPTQPHKSRPSVMVVAFIVTLLVVIGMPLMINTQLAVLSYSIHDNQVEIGQLQEENQQLQAQLNHKSSATTLRESAKREGLVPAGETGYITLETNEVSGGTPAP